MTTDKPTDAMIEAGWLACLGRLPREQMAPIYSAMHKARPQSAAPSPDADLVEALRNLRRNPHLPEAQAQADNVLSKLEALTATAPPSDCGRCNGTKRIEGHDVKCTKRGISVRAVSRPCPDCPSDSDAK